ncbi:MAG: hypothetical protein O2907_01490 [Proteobacteria bacterium]|nr:hypothetical protein [Pseudomonadota bacterium]MDA1063003.1 hypothetical protein [Pseudomonadota bacterium]
MNVIFIEPSFPANQREFVRALHAAGANVIGVGERPVDYLGAEEALQLVDRWMKRMVEQGVNNFVFWGNMALHHAMLGDKDEAFRYLQQAVDNGWNPAGKLTEVVPALAVLDGDSRLEDIQAIMLATLNRDRAVVGLPPFNADYEVQQ